MTMPFFAFAEFFRKIKDYKIRRKMSPKKLTCAVSYLSDFLLRHKAYTTAPVLQIFFESDPYASAFCLSCGFAYDVFSEAAY